jgi:transposase InsO family protein
MRRLCALFHVHRGWYATHENALIESFFKTLRREELSRRCYHTATDAYASVAAYLNVYNTERLHSRLGYQPPAEFEERCAVVGDAQAHVCERAVLPRQA